MNIQLSLICALWLTTVIASARTWTSVSGSTVEAEFKALQGTMVILESAEGKRLMIPLSHLSPEDQQFVHEQTARPVTPPVPTPTSRAREPQSSRQPAVPSSTPPPGRSAAGSTRKDAKEPQPTPLSEAEIAAFKREFTDERTGDKYEFVGGMTTKHHLAEKEPDWKEGDPIPAVITCELVRIRTKKDGTTDRKREDGTAEFYIVDEAGTVLFRRKERLSALEPEKGKGYRGEIPKPGKYTVVIWTEFKGNRLGLTETVQARPPVRR